MPRTPHAVNPDWPHKCFADYPDEIHISPRQAYFTQDKELMALPLEELSKEDVTAAYAAMREAGIQVDE